MSNNSMCIILKLTESLHADFLEVALATILVPVFAVLALHAVLLETIFAFLARHGPLACLELDL